ncbi:hypothetical protein F4806DRAFT_366832 [Annulohypoxylon nitens]|nr:hypothetical protein F4806DRAFT_366832 [Annulohypoxylon nitens]
MDLTTNRVTCRLTLDLVGLSLVSTLYSPENSRALRQGQPRSLTVRSINVLTCYGLDEEALSGLPSLPQTDLEASDFRLMLQLEWTADQPLTSSTKELTISTSNDPGLSGSSVSDIRFRSLFFKSARTRNILDKVSIRDPRKPTIQIHVISNIHNHPLSSTFVHIRIFVHVYSTSQPTLSTLHVHEFVRLRLRVTGSTKVY